MSIHPIFILYAGLALSACATPQTPEQRAESLIATHGPYCDKLGFERASDNWRYCVMQAEATAVNKTAAQAARSSAGIAAAANTRQAMEAARRPIRCTHLGCN